MKKSVKSILSITCACVSALSLASCMGESAYDIAVKNGFSGTEEQWLQSLKGEKGEDAPALTFEDLYQTAVSAGFEGSLLDFCKSIGVEIYDENNTAQIAQNINSVVSINCAFYKNTSVGILGILGGTEEYLGSAAGSGVVLDYDEQANTAYIVTNYHVVYNEECNGKRNVSDDIYIYTYGARNYFNRSTGEEEGGDYMKATFVGGAMDYDIAILKIENEERLKTALISEAKIAKTDTVLVGQKTFVVGNPEGEGIAVTSGVISVESEYITMTATDNSNRYVDYRVMRTDAAINGGNSGGGIFNADGELIGIVNAKSVGTELDNIGYALPITQVKHICQNIVDNGGYVKRAMLGVMVSTEKVEVSLDEDGNLVTKETFMVAETGNIATSSFEKLRVGDVFRTIQVNDGEVITLTRQYQLNDILLTVRKGDIVKIGVNGDGEGNEIKIVEILFDKNAYFTDYQ